MSIDWSKAPEGATHAKKHQSWEYPDWYKIVDGQLMVHSCNDGWDRSGYYSLDNISDLQEKPDNAWPGQGLPPIGAVCETQYDGDQWDECVILAHSKMPDGEEVAVFQCGFKISHSNAIYFRPLRTPEQLAAEERERVIEEIAAETGLRARDGRRVVAERIYDAGYRKQESAK